MASTFTTSLQIQRIGTGEQSGVWGSSTNTNWDLIEQAVAGVQSITMLNTDYTLVPINGTLDEPRNAVLVVGGTNSAVRKIVIPAVSKVYVVYNNTSGGYAITIGTSGGGTVTIANGTSALVYCDATNTFSGVTGSTGNFAVSGNLAVSGTTSLTNGSISGIITAPTAAAGTSTTQLATTAFVGENGTPTGSLLMWSTTSAPNGYLLCNGSAVSRTTYATLFAVIGTTFGSGDGSTTFNVPNYTNRMPYGTTIGATGGSADAIIVSHTHTASFTGTALPAHSHTVVANPGGTSGAFGGGSSAAATTITSSSVSAGTPSGTVTVDTIGSSGTNANLPPYLGINFIIKI